MLATIVAPVQEVRADPIVGWRTWTLSGSDDGTEVRLLPLAGDQRPWPPREPTRAACARGGRHVVPGLGCTCGLYATHGLRELRHSRDPAVLGTVALWGTVVEHTAGFRGEYAYPQRLQLVCFVCFFRWGPARGGPCDVAVRRRGGRLVPLCAPDLELCRRYGYPVRRVLDGRELEQRLLCSYAVDVLRIM